MHYRFLLYISYSYAIPIGTPLEDEIKRRGYDVKWFADEEEGKNSIRHKANTLSSIKEVVAYKPHIVLTATDNVPDFISGLKVQIFHGFFAQKRPQANNTFAHFRVRGFFDLYCTQGPSSTKGFSEKQKEHPHFTVKETGWSKVDPLFPVVFPEKKQLQTVLIASTFTERLSLAYNEDVREEIRRLSETGKYNFKMVLHPKIPTEIVEQWKALTNKNFTYYPTTDLAPLFKESHLLFADTTSAIQEFLLQKKPVVTFNHTFKHHYLIHATKALEIEPALQKGLNPDSELLSHIETFINELHPYFDGKSSQRIIDTCISYAHQSKEHIKNKPLNLIRKFKIRKQLGYFTFKSYNKPYVLKKSNKTMEKLTAIIPTGNEAHNIEAVIASLHFADEILVVDSYSTDGTYEKAKQLADRVIQRKFDYPSTQKNWAIPQAKHQWILLLDADERVTPELEREVKEILRNPPSKEVAGYWIGRINHFMGKRVNYSGWRNDKVIRLFRRDQCRYNNKLVHEEIETDGTVLKLKNKLLHYSYISLDHYLEKMNRYANWQAEEYDKKTGKLTPYHFIIKPFWGFFKHYIIQSGFRDGVVGLTIGYIQGYTVYMRYAKLWLLRKNRK